MKFWIIGIMPGKASVKIKEIKNGRIQSTSEIWKSINCEFVLKVNMTNSTKEPKCFYSKAQAAFSLAPFFMPTFQFVLVFGILILCKIERKEESR